MHTTSSTTGFNIGQVQSITAEANEIVDGMIASAPPGYTIAQVEFFRPPPECATGCSCTITSEMDANGNYCDVLDGCGQFSLFMAVRLCQPGFTHGGGVR